MERVCAWTGGTAFVGSGASSEVEPLGENKPLSGLTGIMTRVLPRLC